MLRYGKMAALFVTALALCLSAAAGEKVIGFSNRTLNGSYFAALSENIKKEGEKAGYKVILTDARGDFTKQIADAEDLLAQKIDYLILNPQDPKAGLQIVKRANQAKVPVIIIDSGLGAAAVLTRIASSNSEGNELIGNHAAELAGDKPVKLALVSFMAGNMACKERRVNFITGLYEKQLQTKGAAQIEIVMQTWAQGTDEGGLKCMEDILTAHPEVTMVYTETSLHLKGMLNAIRAAKRDKDLLVFSFDGAKMEYDAIKKGQLNATAENSPFKLANLAIEVITRYENGERSFPDTMNPKAVMVNKDNVDAVYEYGF